MNTTQKGILILGFYTLGLCLILPNYKPKSVLSNKQYKELLPLLDRKDLTKEQEMNLLIKVKHYERYVLTNQSAYNVLSNSIKLLWAVS